MRPATRRASNTSSASIFSPAPRNLIGRPVTARMESAAPPRRVAVGAGQDQAGERQALVEGLGGAHRVLAGQAVGDQQGLGRAGDAGDLGRLAHHRLVQRGAAGGVEDQDVVAAAAWPPSSARRAMSGGGLAGARSAGCRPRPACRAVASCSMAAGRRVSSEAISTFLRSVLDRRSASLADSGGLARALQAGHQDHRRRVERQVAAARPSSPPSISTRPS